MQASFNYSIISVHYSFRVLSMDILTLVWFISPCSPSGGLFLSCSLAVFKANIINYQIELNKHNCEDQRREAIT